MPGFDDHRHWHHHGPGGPGFRGFRGDGLEWFPVLPGLLTTLLLVAALLHLTGYDRVLADRVRDRLGRRRDDHARWEAAEERYGRTARAFAAFECDAGAVLARPALADVTHPATARFVEAFAEASALRTDGYPGPGPTAQFVRAAEAAERGWLAAVDAADRTRAARFAPGERALLDQAVKLLATAQSSDHDAERHTAYRRAVARLAELERRTGWALPRPAAIALEHRARGVLTAAG